MKEKVEAYLKDMELAWSKKTLKDAKSALNRVLPALTGDSRALWDDLVKTQSGYSRVTTWGIVSRFWDFAFPDEENPYRTFQKKNKRLFKDQYFKKPATLSIEDAKEKIESISDPSIRKKALELLYSGMRWGESLNVKEDVCDGKTGKRKVVIPKIEGPKYEKSYLTFLRALKDVGLKPHDLRKIGLTEVVKAGADVFELQKIAGWKSLNSAASYIGVKPERLEQIMGVVRGDRRRKESP
jgi:site-specific recombinase XerD